ncbi:MAG: hypothetical protein NC299_15715 [Lachnospiraceae bacterium]|nr:hypothetical protein [Ruminococcus sp.]MCM1276781.1 hypothetical protein [Lachnospiraceae bacterium]
MTAFETTTQNIQKVLDVINSGHYTAKTQIAKDVGVSPTLISNIFKRIEPEISVVGKVYKTNCTKVEETEFYKKFSVLIPVVLSNPTIMLWQNKYISSMLDLSTNEVQTLRAYVDDKIRIEEMLQRRNSNEKV